MGRLLEPLLPDLGIFALDAWVHLRQVIDIEVFERFLRGADKRNAPSGGEQDYLVRGLQAFDVVRDNDDGAIRVGHVTHDRAHAAGQPWVEPGGRLVQEEEPRLADEFGRNTGSFLLAAAEAAQQHVTSVVTSGGRRKRAT